MRAQKDRCTDWRGAGPFGEHTMYAQLPTIDDESPVRAALVEDASGRSCSTVHMDVRMTGPADDERPNNYNPKTEYHPDMTDGRLTVDHVTVAGNSLDDLVKSFDERVATPQYGGHHSNGQTHMSQMCFPDGSYLELIAPLEEADPPWWEQFLRESGGLCSWAITVDDIESVTAHVADAGIDVAGPFTAGRERPDRSEIRWQFAFLGPGEPGTTLPFLIEDETSRTARVPETEEDGACIAGIDRVVIGVHDLSKAVESYRTAFELEAPTRCPISESHAEAAVFRSEPVVLVTPEGEGGWLADRIRTYGACPVACLFTPRSSRIEAVGPVSEEPVGDGLHVRWLEIGPRSWGRFGLTS